MRTHNTFDAACDLQVYLVPRAIYKDPFRGGDNILVMCDTYEPPRMTQDGTMTDIKPIPTNTRHACNEVMEKAKAEEPWFGIEQVSNCITVLTITLLHRTQQQTGAAHVLRCAVARP